MMWRAGVTTAIVVACVAGCRSNDGCRSNGDGRPGLLERLRGNRTQSAAPMVSGPGPEHCAPVSGGPVGMPVSGPYLSDPGLPPGAIPVGGPQTLPPTVVPMNPGVVRPLPAASDTLTPAPLPPVPQPQAQPMPYQPAAIKK